jgi:hypothetical protein
MEIMENSSLTDHVLEGCNVGKVPYELDDFDKDLRVYFPSEVK